MKLCDLHTHVLPGEDDGAPTMEYALDMLRNAAASDVALLATTPHFGGPYGYHPNWERGFEALRQAAADIPVQLVSGAELWVDTPGLEALEKGLVPTLNGSAYLLVEFGPNTPGRAFLPELERIQTLGYRPLVAHPERYMAVCQSPRLITDWLDMGCHVQLTGDSIMGAYGKTVQQTATTLLKQGLVACIASDAHGRSRRSNYLLDVYDHLQVHYDKHYAGCLLYENPTAILHGEEV